MALCDRRSIKSYGRRMCVKKTACSLCDYYIMGSWLYVIVLGFIGTIISVLDTIRAICCRVSNTSSSSCYGNNDEVPVSVERDLKLMISILGIEHHIFMMLGAITEYSILHTPWLLMQFCVIIVEIVIFFVKFLLGNLHIRRNKILQMTLSLYNWLQVFCLFLQQT